MGCIFQALLFVLFCASLAVTGLMILHAFVDRRTASGEDSPAASMDARRRDRR
jgi:hypothetical protein